MDSLFFYFFLTYKLQVEEVHSVKACGTKTWFDVSPLWSASKGVCHCLCDSIPNIRTIRLNPQQLACPNETQENLKTKTPETKSRGLAWWKVGCKVFTSVFSSKHLSLVLACLKRKGEEWQYYFNQRWPNVTGEFISPCTALLSCIDMFACIPIEQLITPFHMIRQNSPEERLDCAFELRGFHSIPARHTFLNAFLQHMSPRDVSSRPFLRGMNLEHDSFEHTAWKCRGHISWRRFLFFNICVFYIFTEFECNEKTRITLIKEFETSSELVPNSSVQFAMPYQRPFHSLEEKYLAKTRQSWKR